ncbi:MAG: hypothetical protein ACK46C_03125 [Flavobacteriales bacterium]
MEAGRDIMHFRNTCSHCCNDVEIPILSDFAYGEILFQSADARSFAIVDLINNSVFDEVLQALEKRAISESVRAEIAQPMLCDLSDEINGQPYSTIYPRCPLCGQKMSFWSDEHRVGMRHLPAPQWSGFTENSPERRMVILDSLIAKHTS